ncbi:MAG: DUF4124 domain-containing protein [Ottowia sp.]|uniref:DUF4124 domain-containing protein n=1 Tax=Ottowia sp. TaxID=1898956 RepID=UPI0039E71118
MPVSLRPLLSHLPLVAAALALGAAGTPAGAQASKTAASSIYTCVDAQGRRLTSDRPILACLDREQRELSNTGILRRVIPPGMTATEREAREAREREAYVERQRARDTIRRDQALITRYPDKAAHDAGRKEALAQTQAVVDTAERRIAELAAERRTLDDEMEFYRKDPSRAPAKLRRAIESNAQEVEEQRRAIAGQQDERNRIHARFDDEAQRLQPLWQAAAAQAAKTPASSTQR